MARWLLITTKITHVMLWVLGAFALLLTLALFILAYGLPGQWFQSTLDSISGTPGALKMQRLSYLPGRGVTVVGLVYKNTEGEVRCSFSKGRVAFSLFSTAPFSERITAITVDDLYIAQIPKEVTIDEPPDFSSVQLPKMNNVTVTLNRSNLLEIVTEYATATMNLSTRKVDFADIKVKVNDQETADGTVAVDFDTEIADIILRCHLHPHQLHGIWRALDIPIIEAYINNFRLKQPAWGEGEISVGLNKFDNHFSFHAVISANEGGTYCGVPFDEVSCELTSKGISDCVTTFAPITARREGKIVAEGTLSFDCGTDNFTFSAKSDALTPEECLQITELPFENVLDDIYGNGFPRFSIRGSMPFRVDPTPKTIQLSGAMSLPEGGKIHNFNFDSAVVNLKMANGVLALRNLEIHLPTDEGLLRGAVDFTFPQDLQHTDVRTQLTLKKVQMNDLAGAFVSEADLPSAALDGSVDLSFRTDETLPSSLQGDFDLIADGELITRSWIFSGLIKVLSDYVPGMSELSDNSTAHVKGTVHKGIFTIPDFILTGNLFSIEGPLTYDLPEDKLSGTLSAGNFKEGSVMGTLTRWATLSVNTYVWQIRVHGPLHELDWSIETFVKKIWDKAVN